MDRLRQISQSRVQQVQPYFTRYLMGEIRWKDRMIGISGPRGSGKTTLLLQYMKTRLPSKDEAMYASLDDIYFSKNPLVLMAEEFHRKGGKHLFLDEVHKYQNWSQELKNIYDNLPDLQIVFTSSSALDIYKGTHDLSRRALVYRLPGLSYREFLELRHGIVLPTYTKEQIFNDSSKIVPELLDRFKPLQYFDEYIRHGYYPFFVEAEHNYLDRMLNVLNVVLESDLPSIFNIDYYSVIKIKKMLAVLARIVPYKPNIEKLVRQTGTTRDTLLKYLFYLEKAEIVKWLSKDTFGINYLNKPDKLYLNNTNLMFALNTESPDKGSIRETFVLNQLLVRHKVSYPSKGDFLIDGEYLVEVGGKSKGPSQVAGMESAFIVADDIEYPDENKIPMWLLGFLY